MAINVEDDGDCDCDDDLGRCKIPKRGARKAIVVGGVAVAAAEAAI